jgi:hypothetical protein
MQVLGMGGPQQSPMNDMTGMAELMFGMQREGRAGQEQARQERITESELKHREHQQEMTELAEKNKNLERRAMLKKMQADYNLAQKAEQRAAKESKVRTTKLQQDLLNAQQEAQRNYVQMQRDEKLNRVMTPELMAAMAMAQALRGAPEGMVKGISEQQGFEYVHPFLNMMNQGGAPQPQTTQLKRDQAIDLAPYGQGKM